MAGPWGDFERWMERYGSAALLVLVHGTSIWFAWNHDWFDAAWPSAIGIAYATRNKEEL